MIIDEYMNSDELFRRMDEDELQDKAAHYGKLPIREAARYFGVQPQLIYYRLRNHMVKRLTCDGCGREDLIDIAELGRSLGRETETETEEEGESWYWLDAFSGAFAGSCYSPLPFLRKTETVEGVGRYL